MQANNLNPNLLEAKYAVRGAIVQAAAALVASLKKGEKHDFDEVVFCNIGNPQTLGQKPITFLRQVLALCDYPELMDGPAAAVFPSDAIERAKAYLNAVRSVGAYSHSQGIELVREEVAAFISERDGFPSNAENVFLTDGASPGVQAWVRASLRSSSDGLMIPIPQYPLYSACIPLYGGTPVHYFLNEEQGWGLSVDELKRSHDEAVAAGINPRGVVVINPGNPTGQCLTAENIADILGFCADRKVVCMADEVYQANVYVSEKPFVSFKKVLCELQAKDATRFGAVQLVSFHSTSKGVTGECGKRGGYFEAVGFEPELLAELYKLASISLCPNVLGQLAVGLLVNPPKAGQPSYEQYQQETSAIYESLKRRAQTVADSLRQLEGVTCNPSEGAMYAFPQIAIPTKAVEAAKEQKVTPDYLYCKFMLDNAGICMVPGAGFGQKEGTFHFRTTFLPLEEQLMPVLERMKGAHGKFMSQYK